MPAPRVTAFYSAPPARKGMYAPHEQFTVVVTTGCIVEYHKFDDDQDRAMAFAVSVGLGQVPSPCGCDSHRQAR